MFWIGMIVGIALTIAAFVGIYHLAVMSLWGSHEEYDRAYQVLSTANENRKCVLMAVHDDGEVFKSYVLEEKE